MTTTPSTASQAPAVTIADDDEFIDLMHALSSVPSSVYAGSEFSKVINYIDAKIAQARVSGVKAANDFRELVSDGDTAEIKEWKARATAAEAKLEAIRKGVEGLQRYDNTECWGMEPNADGGYLDYLQVSDILQSQPQADESGLPG